MPTTPVQTHVQIPVQAPAQPPVPTRSRGRAALLRGRIGTGFSPEPHRYRLYVAADDCPSCLGVTAAFADLGLRDTVALTVLRPGSDPAGHEALRRAYEAAGHDHDGTLTVPALCDGWSGRVVSNHAPDILEDLRRLSVHPAFRPGR
ncbi:hypothetical protein [Streptomyces sp. NBC_01264]|uniref:hypothetical protein n=1 Tax=Streptomyces sp. NBC_01264 TaxID=2903804 RepID=UPI0022543E6C|nr:hypothetical protein [Streptomyces sp. NBC_01264]MCX4777083.1 hypothetical protein [Streptomyces sp. NBC_01264]